MTECFKCGISSDRIRIFDAISKEGLVHVCEKCAEDENIPVVKKPTTFQLKEAESPAGVYQRLSNMAGVNADEHKKKFGIPSKGEEILKKQETTLKEIVDRNYQKKMEGEKPQSRPELIDNFHWIIMRVRRMRKLTQEQLAREIGEAKSAIEMAEKGILPDDYPGLINKLEDFLGIRIKKKTPFGQPKGVKEGEIEPMPEKPKPTELRFDKDTTKALTIADLKEMKAEQNTKVIEEDIKEDLSLNEEAKRKLEEMKKEE